jgi:GTP-binding protein LepA
VFSSVYPEDQEDFENLKKALERLKLVDSALFFEEESSGVLGRGFRCGFLGMLHLEIVVERLLRDFEVKTIAATPSVKYKIETRKGEQEIYSPHRFPDENEIKEIYEPWLRIEILLPPDKLSGVIKLLNEHEAEVGDTGQFSESRIKVEGKMPLRELMRDFFDELKSISSGYASLNYEFEGMRSADLLRLDILVAEESVPAFARIVPRHRMETEGEAVVEKLYHILPKALFALKIQARAGGRILASRTIKAASKDVTQHMYGGDRTRKMKLWKKQKEGKKRLSAEADYDIPPDAYLKLMKK